MDSPQDSPQPLVDSGAAPLPASPRTLTMVLMLGGLIVLATFFGRHLLIQMANDTGNDSAPAPRPRINAPFIKSADVVVDTMLEVAQITQDDLVYDLGCGDGRIIVTAAHERGCRGVGFDIDPERVAEANKNVQLHDVGQLVEIKEQDIFQVDLSKANVAVMYLLPWMMQKLPPQFEQMQPGSRIVSHDFYIEGVEPERVVEISVGPNDTRHFVFLYTVPLCWNPNMPNKPPLQGLADRAEANKAAAETAANKTEANKTEANKAEAKKTEADNARVKSKDAAQADLREEQMAGETRAAPVRQREP